MVHRLRHRPRHGIRRRRRDAGPSGIDAVNGLGLQHAAHPFDACAHSSNSRPRAGVAGEPHSILYLDHDIVSTPGLAKGHGLTRIPVPDGVRQHFLSHATDDQSEPRIVQSRFAPDDALDGDTRLTNLLDQRIQVDGT
jgi:hypothetical protein